MPFQTDTKRHPRDPKGLLRGGEEMSSPRPQGAALPRRGSDSLLRGNDSVLRIGCVRYLNTLPFCHQFHLAGDTLQIAEGNPRGKSVPIHGKAVFHKAVPAELNRLIREGQLDIALVSSLEYARHPERYQILPGFCIGAGKLSESVLLISKVPLLELAGRTAVLSEESLSSQVLLKILFKKLKIEARFRSGTQTPQRMLEEGDACLLIGDGALTFDLPKNYYRYDLSSLWNDMTGLPFCFALWVVRREFAEGSPGSVRAFLSSLEETFRSNMRDKAAMLAGSGSLPQKDLLSCDRYLRYLSDLYFEWSAPLEAGLVKYYEFAQEIGELERVPELEYFSDASSACHSRVGGNRTDPHFREDDTKKRDS